ncbi:hypothetical protein [Candidatus Desulforudis audaxviator]|uniref:hypothetical protein n=1 Tax=Candidatus Desulforudis audaxviator TaxID=471827 RepID=UPI0002E1D797|nr:hypothetical protein [Candidatus Desulforudis audaxviator]AZK59345.1 hypothetical protein Daudx_0792 [Candidatus Desulforudis audaxviator]
METVVVGLILVAAIHQFWTGHKKDKAGQIKAGRLHMFFSIALILAGIWYISRIQ